MYNNFETSLVVFMPTQITTNHAITYINCESSGQRSSSTMAAKFKAPC